MFHYHTEYPHVPQKVIEKRWVENIELKIDALKEHKKEIDKRIDEFQEDLKAIQ
jgi:chaperonin cofactor prefoldin